MNAERMAWGIKFASDNRLDGYQQHLGGLGYLWAEGEQAFRRHEAFHGYITMAFATREQARAFIKANFAYFTRPDLKAEPHGWKMPRPVRVRILVEAIDD